MRFSDLFRASVFAASACAWIGLAAHAHAASFDCAKAATFVEKAICADAELSRLDDQLTGAYRTSLANTQSPDVLRARQREWLAERNACTDAECVKAAYAQRLADFGATDPMAKPAKTTATKDAYEGEYERRSKKEPASITVERMADGRYHLTGDAEWIGNADLGQVNSGQIEGTFPMTYGRIDYRDATVEGDDACRFTIEFSKNVLTVSGDPGTCGGVNVNFDGIYRKVKTKK